MVKYLKIFAKSILYGLVGIFLLIFTFILLLRAPSNQTLLAQYFSPKIEKAIGYPLTVKGIQLKFFDEVSFWGLRVKDPWGKDMIYIERLDINFNLSDLFLQGAKPTMEYARLLRPRVHLILEKKSGKINMNEFIDRLIVWLSSETPTKSTESAIFKIQSAEVVDGIFLLDDEQEKNLSSATHFDISHFSFVKINAKVNDFFVKGDTIGLQTIGLQTIDPASGFRVKKLDTHFMICEKQMRFDQLDLRFNDSFLKDQVVMNYQNLDDLTQWIPKVRMVANLKKSQVKGEDVSRFIEAMTPYKGTYRLNGLLDGTVANLGLKNFELGFGQNSVLRGNFNFKGLPNIDKTQMDFDMKKSLFLPKDLAIFISSSAANKMQILGPVAFEGNFQGTNQRFKTFGKLNTGLGYLEGNVQMDLKDSMALSGYEGGVKLRKFQLGKLLDLQAYLGNIDLEGKIKGRGFSKKSAHVDFDGKVSEIHFNQYAYKRVSFKGNFQRQLFKGAVSVRDSNLIASMEGEINLQTAKASYLLNGNIEHAHLGKLRLMKEAIQLSSGFELDLRFNTLDDLLGRASFTDLNIRKPGMQDLPIGLLSFSANKNFNGDRHYQLNSDLISIDINGNFIPSNLQKDLVQVWDEYAVYFLKTSTERQQYYSARTYDTERKYQADFTIICHQAAPILSRFYPSLGIGKNTVFSGNITKGRTLALSLESYPDTLVFGGYRFYQSVFSLQSSKFLGGPEVSSSLVFQSRRQQLNFLSPTENFKLNALWDQDKINFGLDFKQQGEDNLAHFGGNWKFEKDGLSLRFKDSYMKILGQDWAIDPENKITIKGPEWKAEQVLISNKKQSISLQGSLSMDSTETLKLRANKFQLATLGPLFAIKAVGELNAEVSIQNWYQNTRLDSWLIIDSLRLNKFYMGNFQGVGTYLAESQLMDLNYHLNRFGESVLTVSGAYKPYAETNKLNIKAELNKTNLGILEPFTEGVFSGLSGDASGELRIGGSVDDPNLQGRIVVQKGKVNFDYLNTAINVSDTVVFQGRQIIGKNWTLKDNDGNAAKLNAKVNFPKDKPFEMSLSADLTRYKILNTQRNPASLYFGTGIASGLFQMDGTLQDLRISGNLKSERGTKLYIPLDREFSSADEQDYEFLSESLHVVSEEKLANKPTSTDVPISLDLTLNLTPDAYGEVQFDSKKGDIMRVYGSGGIKMTLDKKGAFKMNGDYAIDQGDYTFTLQNLINKKFAIQRGSKISWKGDPLDANVDIKAVYTQYASLFPILLDTTNKGNLPEFKRRYPVDITINLQNRLLSPNVSFDIGIRDYPKDMTLNGAVTAFTNRIKTDEQELTRQVSNILLFGQLVSPFGGSGIALGNLVGNFTEMLSNQLSNLASQINKDLNIDVYLGGGSLTQDILTNLQLRASYNVNNRLRISRSGGFTDARNQTSPQILLGDWALEWFVKRDGSLRAKTYNRNVQTTLLGSLNSYQINQTFGASLVFNKSFNSFWGTK